MAEAISQVLCSQIPSCPHPALHPQLTFLSLPHPTSPESLFHSPYLHDLINSLILCNFSLSQKCCHTCSCAKEQVSPAKIPRNRIGGSWGMHIFHSLRCHQSACQSGLPVALPAAGMGKSWCFISLPPCGTVQF